MSRKVEINNDVFDIARRLKEIDDGYFVLYDKKLMRFEVHNRRQRPDTLCLVLPYDTLDCRAIERVLRTRLDNIEKELKTMDEFNEKVSKKHLADNVEKHIAIGGELFDRLSKT